MTDERCECPMSISVLGDGCRYCQPQEHIDRLSECLEDAENELSTMSASETALHDRLMEYSRMYSKVCEDLHNANQTIIDLKSDIESAITWVECDIKEEVRDASIDNNYNDIYISCDKVIKILERSWIGK